MTCEACDRKRRAQAGEMVTREVPPAHTCGLVEAVVDPGNKVVHLVNNGQEHIALVEPGRAACGKSVPWVVADEPDRYAAPSFNMCKNCARVALSYAGPYWQRAVEARARGET